MITVACVYWKGEFRGREKLYTPEWVGKLKNMVERNLQVPYRFVCLSNVEVPCERIPLVDNLPGYWSKIELFRPGIFEGRVLYLDLDLIILKDLMPFINRSSPFTIMAAPKAHSRSRKKEGKIRVPLYNSSVMSFDAGVADDLYMNFNDKMRRTFFGDQDYIGHSLPELEVFPEGWILKLRDCPDGLPTPKLKIALCMMGRKSAGKNITAAKEYKWVKELWI